MRSFRNNNKRSRFRSNGDKNFKRNGQNTSFIEGQNFQRKSPGRNNQNANKLIEKYSDLAREALSNGDKILSENYYQYAEHFIRVLGEKEMLYNKNQKSKEVTDEKTESTQKNINNIDSNSSEKSINSNEETILNSKN